MVALIHRTSLPIGGADIEWESQAPMGMIEFSKTELNHHWQGGHNSAVDNKAQWQAESLDLEGSGKVLIDYGIPRGEIYGQPTGVLSDL